MSFRQMFEEEVVPSDIFFEKDGNDPLLDSLSSLDISDEVEDNEKFIRIDDPKHLFFKHVYNVNNCNRDLKILDRIPITPPNEPGTFFCIINGNLIKSISLAYQDRLSPWSSATKKPHYNDCCLIKVKNDWKFVKTLKDDAVFSGNVYDAIHPENSDIKKWVYSATFKDQKVPGQDTFIVIVYRISKSYVMPPMPSNFRLQPHITAELKPLLQTGSAKEVHNKYNSNGKLMDNDPSQIVTHQQVQRLGNRMTDRETRFHQGRRANENEEKFQKVCTPDFVKDSAKGDGYERYFCAIDSALSLFEHELFAMEELEQLTLKATMLDSNTSNTRFESIAEFINTQEYKDQAFTGILMADETYNLGRLTLTVIIYVSRNFLNKDGRPAQFTVAYMLSKGKTKEDFKWMAQCLTKRIKSKGKVVRGYGSDGALSLDGLCDAPFIKPPVPRFMCTRHAKVLFAEKCAHDVLVLDTIFGYIDSSSGVKHPGIFDLPYDDYLQKVADLATTDAWQKYPEIIKWTQNKSRLDFYYQRCCIKVRIMIGYGFDEGTTSPLEGENFQIKTVIDTNTPLHELVPKLKLKQTNQIENFAMSIFQKNPVQLRDEKKFLGAINFGNYSDENKRKKLKGIGIKHSDQLPSFAKYSNTFPQEFAPKTTETERMLLMDQAATYGVTSDPSNKDVYIVGKSPEYVGVKVNEQKVSCQCKVIKHGALICVHILAVHRKYPNFNILNVIKNFMENETIDEKIKRETQPSDGAKPGTSRRTGRNSTRNTRRKPTEQMIDLSYENSNASSALHIKSPASSISSSSSIRKRPNPEATNSVFNRSDKSGNYSSSAISSSTAASASAAKKRTYEVVQLGDSDSEEVMEMHTPQLSRPGSVVSFNPAGRSFPSTRLPRSIRQPNVAPIVFTPIIPQSLAPRRPPLPRFSNINSVERPANDLHVIPGRNAPQASTSVRLPQVPQVNKTRTVQTIPPLDYEKDDAGTKNAYLLYYRLHQPIPSHANYCIFVLRELRTVPNVNKKKCNQCHRNLPNIVVGHYETYNYTNSITKQLATAATIRFICASADCVYQRYPYAKRNCFKSELTAELTDSILDEFAIVFTDF